MGDELSDARTSGSACGTRWRRLVPLAVWLVTVCGAVAGVLHVQDSGKRELEARFSLRAAVGAQFVQSYVEDLFRHEREQAVALLAGPTLTERDRLEARRRVASHIAGLSSPGGAGSVATRRGTPGCAAAVPSEEHAGVAFDPQDEVPPPVA